MAKQRTAPGAVEAYPSPTGEINFQVISAAGTRFENILVSTKQGYKRKAGVNKGREALEHALATAGEIEYLTRDEYLSRQARRRREAAKRRAARN